MTVRLDLPDETLRRLQAEAARRGVTVENLVTELTTTLPARASTRRGRDPAFVGIGASKHGITDRIDEILADGFGHD